MRALKIVVCIGVIVAVGLTLSVLASPPDNTPPVHYKVGIVQKARDRHKEYAYRVGVMDPESGIHEYEVMNKENVKDCEYRIKYYGHITKKEEWTGWMRDDDCKESMQPLKCAAPDKDGCKSGYPRDIQINVFYNDTTKEMKFKVWAKNGDDLTSTSGTYTAPANPETKAFPTLTEWGLIALGVLLAGSLTWMIHKRVVARPSGA